MKADLSVSCWGLDHKGQASPPAGKFTSVSVGIVHTCGVTENSTVACWGSDAYNQASPPAGEFISVSASSHTRTCGVMKNGSVACWGTGAQEEIHRPLSGEFSSISVAGTLACGVRKDHSVACWGWEHTNGRTNPPPPTHAERGIPNRWHTCRTNSEGLTSCKRWDSQSGEPMPPADEFTSVSTGGDHICGLPRMAR